MISEITLYITESKILFYKFIDYVLLKAEPPAFDFNFFSNKSLIKLSTDKFNPFLYNASTKLIFNSFNKPPPLILLISSLIF